MNFFTNQVFQEVKRMQYQMEYPGMADNFKILIKNYTDGINQRSMQWSNLCWMLNVEPKIQQQKFRNIILNE